MPVSSCSLHGCLCRTLIGSTMGFVSQWRSHAHVRFILNGKKISNRFLTKYFSELTGKDRSICSAVLLQIKNTGFQKLFLVISLLSHPVTFCSYVPWLRVAASVVWACKISGLCVTSVFGTGTFDFCKISAGWFIVWFVSEILLCTMEVGKGRH